MPVLGIRTPIFLAHCLILFTLSLNLRVNENGKFVIFSRMLQKRWGIVQRKGVSHRKRDFVSKLGDFRQDKCHNSSEQGNKISFITNPFVVVLLNLKFGISKLLLNRDLAITTTVVIQMEILGLGVG